MSSPSSTQSTKAEARPQKRPADSGDGASQGSGASHWGDAQLTGDDARKQKFMRLMGGTKEKKQPENVSEVSEESAAPADKNPETPMSTFVPEDVRSANDWEHASLKGGDNRKQKFMRLLGAGKGNADAGSQRKREDPNSIDNRLEEQYNQGMELRLSGAPRRHVGLGFHTEDSAKPDSSTSKEPQSSDHKSKPATETSVPSSSDNNEADAKESESPPKTSEEAGGKYSKMGFVTSS